MHILCVYLPQCLKQILTHLWIIISTVQLLLSIQCGSETQENLLWPSGKSTMGKYYFLPFTVQPIMILLFCPRFKKNRSKSSFPNDVRNYFSLRFSECFSMLSFHECFENYSMSLGTKTKIRLFEAFIFKTFDL